MVSVSADDVRDVINVGSSDIPDTKVLKMIKRAEKSYALKGQAVENAEAGIETIMVCNNHTPPFYSSQKPVEVRLK